MDKFILKENAKVISTLIKKTVKQDRFIKALKNIIYKLCNAQPLNKTEQIIVERIK